MTRSIRYWVCASLFAFAGLPACDQDETETRGDGGRAGGGFYQPQGQGQQQGLPQGPNGVPGGSPFTFPQGTEDNGCGQFQDSLGSEVSIDSYSKVPILGNVPVQLVVDAQIGIKTEDKTGVFQFGGTIKEANNAIVRQFAEKGFSDISHPMNLTLISNTARADLIAESSGWDGLDCLPAITKVESQTLHVEYDPAIPLMIPPNSAELLDTLGGGITIDGITAVVKKSPDQETPLNQPVTGSATITKSGNKVTIAYDFGTLKQTVTATSFKSLAFDIDLENKRYNSIDAAISLNSETVDEVTITRQGQ